MKQTKLFFLLLTVSALVAVAQEQTRKRLLIKLIIEIYEVLYFWKLGYLYRDGLKGGPKVP